MNETEFTDLVIITFFSQLKKRESTFFHCLFSILELRGSYKTPEPHKIALLVPILSALPRLPYRVCLLKRRPSQQASSENWHQNHRFSEVREFCNCLLILFKMTTETIELMTSINKMITMTTMKMMEDLLTISIADVVFSIVRVFV